MASAEQMSDVACGFGNRVLSRSVVPPQRNSHEECKSLNLRIGAFGGQQDRIERDPAVYESEARNWSEERFSVLVGLALTVRDGGTDGPGLGEAIGGADGHVLGPMAPGVVVDARVAEDLPPRCRPPEGVAQTYTRIDFVVSRARLKCRESPKTLSPRPAGALFRCPSGLILQIRAVDRLAAQTAEPATPTLPECRTSKQPLRPASHHYGIA